MEPKRKRLSRARRLVKAIESGDREAERELVAAIGGDELGALRRELPRIVGELRNALCSVRVTEELARLARTELPDAQLGLNQVIEMTEDAAHRTLTAVEDSLPLTDEIIQEIKNFQDRRPAGGESFRALERRVLANAARLRSCLSEVLVAQSFQDLTGQIIRRVAGIVAELEALVGDSDIAPAEERSLRRNRSPHAGEGPALANASGVVRGQHDVDDLLSELGV